MSSSYEHQSRSPSPTFIPLMVQSSHDDEPTHSHQSRFTELPSSSSSSSRLPVPPKFLNIATDHHLQDDDDDPFHHQAIGSPHLSSDYPHHRHQHPPPPLISSPTTPNDPNPIYPPHQPSSFALNISNSSRESFGLSSIHTSTHNHNYLYPVRPFARDSGATWNTSDSDRTRIGSESPWNSKPGMLLDKYDDETEGEGHTYPSPNLGTQRKPTQILNHDHQHLGERQRRKRKMLISAFIALILIALAIGIGAYVGTRKSKNRNGSNGIDGVTNTASGQMAKLWGVGGDKITTEDGSSFIYNNTLGGTWVSIPYNDTAKCQDDSPALDQPWDYSNRRIYGVNLGGWLVLEPFITPYLFEKFNDPKSTQNATVVDEWTLSAALGSDLAKTLEDHYKTFIKEEDFAQIASAGLNWVRLPVGWWMIETWEGEPFLQGVAFKYFVKALNWARKYGLRVNLDLHAVPGSQNGYNHSGKLGTINFLIGLMGVANAQRTLNYIRTLTEFISQPQYVNVVPMFSVLNEALVQKIGASQIRAFYLQVYELVRSITGYGQGKGPMMVIHDGFTGTGAGHLGWGGYLSGADRLGLDTHPYFSFTSQSNDSMDYNAYKPCTYWAKSFNQTNTDFGFNFAGEYSLAINDCGQWLNNVGVGSRFDGTYPNAQQPDLKNFPRVGNCDDWADYTKWPTQLKNSLIALADSSQDAMQNSFFWTWKISHSLNSNLIPNPLWSYSLGLQQQWIRPDARGSLGGCRRAASQQGKSPPTQDWSGTFAEWQVGGKATTSTIDAAQLAQYTVWPPNAITAAQGGNEMYNDIANLPLYTATGTIKQLVADPLDPKLFPASATATAPGDGWYNKEDKSGWYVKIAGCQYPDPWNAGGLPAPTGAFCGVGVGSNTAPVIQATPAPVVAR